MKTGEHHEPGVDQPLVAALAHASRTNARPSRISTAAISPMPITNAGARMIMRSQRGSVASTRETVARTAATGAFEASGLS